MKPGRGGGRSSCSISLICAARLQARSELPRRLFWYPDRTFDLDESVLLREMYETVLQQASRPEDLTTFLNDTILVEVWPELQLPDGLRQVWERRHEVLREGAA